MVDTKENRGSQQNITAFRNNSNHRFQEAHQGFGSNMDQQYKVHVNSKSNLQKVQNYT